MARRIGALRALEGSLMGVPALPLVMLIKLGLLIGRACATWSWVPGVMFVIALAAAFT